MEKSEKLALATAIYGDDVQLVEAVVNATVESEISNIEFTDDGNVHLIRVDDFFKAERVTLEPRERFVWDAMMDFYPTINAYNTLAYLAEQGSPIDDFAFENESTLRPESDINTKSFNGFLNSLTEEAKESLITICETYNREQYLRGRTSFDLLAINGQNGTNVSDGDVLDIMNPLTSRSEIGKVLRAPKDGFIFVTTVNETSPTNLSSDLSLIVLDEEQQNVAPKLVAKVEERYSKIMKSQADCLDDRADVYGRVAIRQDAKAKKEALKMQSKIIAMLKKAQKNGALVYTEAEGTNPQTYEICDAVATSLEQIAELVSLEEVTEAFNVHQATLAVAKESALDEILAMTLDTQEKVTEAVNIANKNNLSGEQMKQVNAIVKKAKADLKAQTTVIDAVTKDSEEAVIVTDEVEAPEEVAKPKAKRKAKVAK